MVVRRRKGHILGIAAILLGLAALVLPPAPPAQAQGLFDQLFRFFGGRSPGPPLELHPSDPFGLTERLIEGELGGGPSVVYCVRLCDGRYFPLPRNVGGGQMTPDKVCSAMCPAATTKTYTGTSVERAAAVDGSAYSNLKNAFVYRERLVTDCTCTGKDTIGVAAIDIHSDPTLRPGDIVVTAAGPMAFKGDKRLPHKTSDFVPAQDYKALPANIRRDMATMRLMPDTNSATVRTKVALPTNIRRDMATLRLTPDTNSATVRTEVALPEMRPVWGMLPGTMIGF